MVLFLNNKKTSLKSNSWASWIDLSLTTIAHPRADLKLVLKEQSFLSAVVKSHWFIYFTFVSKKVLKVNIRVPQMDKFRTFLGRLVATAPLDQAL